MSKQDLNKPRVFISYSHKDEAWKELLCLQLKALAHQGDIVLWDDRKIGTGKDWYPEIERELYNASVAVCLISADYLASDFINKEEIPALKERRQREGMLLLPILVRPCPWKKVQWLKNIQIFPQDGKCLAEIRSKVNQEKALANIVEYIFEKIKDPEFKLPKPSTAWDKLPEDNIYIEKLPVTGMELFGRQKELELLDNAWKSDQTNVISLVAWSGVGKSTLVNKWLERMAQDNYRGAKRVFGWSFYCQGTGERVTSADQFINEALKWFEDPDPTQGSVWDKGQRLADIVRQQKSLLVLDGMEPLQSYLDFEKGKIKDPALSVLITRLSKQNNGLCIITTREYVPDISKYAETTQQINLEQISVQAGRALLRIRGVQGTDPELEKTTKQFGSHALTINLLASYLHEIPGHHISHAEKIPDLDIPEEKGRHPRRVIEAFEKHFGDSSEVQVLNILGLFDKPANISAINAVRSSPAISGLTDHLQDLTDSEWLNVLQTLRNCRLLAEHSTHNSDVLDCHPLVREHFREKLKTNNPDAWKQAHSKLYDYLRLSTKHLPDTLEEMEPLFSAVIHGCQAGRHQETRDDVYWKRINRSGEYYSMHKLGAFGADLAAVSGFFETRWNKPVLGLTEPDKALVLNWAGLFLRALARLREAVQPMQAALEAVIEQENWIGSAKDAGNLSELHLTLGNVNQAKDYAQQSVDFADRSGDWAQKFTKRTTLGDSLHQVGELSKAEALFREAEEIQNERRSEYTYLYSLWGFRFCDLLLSQGKCQEVHKRSEQNIKYEKENWYNLLSIALDKLLLGRALILQSLTVPLSQRVITGGFHPQAIDYFNQAVEGLRESGYQYYLPLGFFARAVLFRIQHKFPEALNDLEEAQEIAECGSMELHLADYHLETCRLHLAQFNVAGINKSSTHRKENIQKSKQHLQKAKTIIEKTGYHRRDPELHLLDAQLYLAEGEKENALKSLTQAKKLFKKMGIRVWDREVEDAEKSALSV